MDFHCIDMLLALPEFRVIHQIMSPEQLELHLERRATSIVQGDRILIFQQ